jgi:hypothetical protein
MSYMSIKWAWGYIGSWSPINPLPFPLIHNCATFVSDIIVAGGGDLTVMLNCPDLEVQNKDPYFNSGSPQPSDAGLPGGV